MPGFVGVPELIMLALVALLVFGPKRLPEMGRSLGRGLREFKDSVSRDGKGEEAIERDELELTVASLTAPEPARVAVTDARKIAS